MAVLIHINDQGGGADSTERRKRHDGGPDSGRGSAQCKEIRDLLSEFVQFVSFGLLISPICFFCRCYA